MYKFPISFTEDVTVRIPVGAQIVFVGQDGALVPCVWALCDPDQLLREDRQFGIYGTGGKVPSWWEYVGTFKQDEALIWHVFENTTL